MDFKMSSHEKPINNKNLAIIQQNLQNLSLATLCKSIAISGLVLFIFYTLLLNYAYPQSNSFSTFSLFKLKWPLSPSYDNNVVTITTTTTNLSHVVFGIVASMNTWNHKRPYVESWWGPNVTRGYVFLDRAPTNEFNPWPSSSPPFRINEDITKVLKVNPKIQRPVQIRIFRTILETFRQGEKDVRWFVMADDDTVFFVDNLVQELVKYDQTKSLYIGMNSECVKANADLSFDMAFGGAGYALSYPLAKALTGMLDGCIERYPHSYCSDFLLGTCLADIGVSSIHQKGFHQIDLHGDISGLLSAHPQNPVLSLHHIDAINLIFPSMNRSASIHHLMNAANTDPSRLLQQTICYNRDKNWTFSISWGYSTHIYEAIHPRSYLRRLLESFKPGLMVYKYPFYMFNTRWIVNKPCQAPHVFFLESIDTSSRSGQVVTSMFEPLHAICHLVITHRAASTILQILSPKF